MEPETKARDRSPKAGMDQPAKETAGVLKVKEVEAEVVGGSEEKEASASAASLLAHPCSLLQLLLRGFAGCLDLRGYDCSDDDPKPDAVVDDLKPAADDDDDDEEAAPAVAETPQEGAGGGGDDEAASVEVVTRVRRTPPSPPGAPGEGTGGGGGQHN